MNAEVYCGLRQVLGALAFGCKGVSAAVPSLRVRAA